MDPLARGFLEDVLDLDAENAWLRAQNHELRTIAFRLAWEVQHSRELVALAREEIDRRWPLEAPPEHELVVLPSPAPGKPWAGVLSGLELATDASRERLFTRTAASNRWVDLALVPRARVRELVGELVGETSPALRAVA